MQTTLVERRTETGGYGILYEQMILDTDTHGRILITEGFGGSDVTGHTYRWLHGLAIQLKHRDTFADLDTAWNESTTTIEAISRGYDATRPILDWSGHAIDAIARRLRHA